MEPLLWLETLIKGGAGFALVLFPGGLLRVLGLTRPADMFWPRLAGALLLALGAAAFLTGSGHMQSGLGIGAAALINAVGAICLIALQIAGKAADTRRGRAIVALVACLLIILAAAQSLATLQ